VIDWKKYPIPRVRHHTSSQLYLPASGQQRLPQLYPLSIAEARWDDWFANGRAARVLDIGCGRGGFMLQHALTYPEQNILGLELRGTLVEWINDVIEGEGITNARAVWYSVANGLDFIPSASIDHIFYLFPDPWPKKRHVKRRAFTDSFLEQLHRVLVPGGRLYLATDRADVDQQQRYQIASLPHERGFDIREVQEPADWPFDFKTDQQLFCERKGIPFVTYYASRR